ncbi:hypothetical protein [Rhizobium halophytocola]|uniref:Uncharacterized protein n=1 Tax=Rhizobium halophytocola TaxID=735519 RepID=A0ABS4DUR1_9HYPH|nr:hypothetical protein [Rhizobium halophytocola]MBP1849428.1 hypothetical protein [Rhizobium halophytocola]
MRLILFVNSIALQVTDDQLLLGAWILERTIATQGEEEAEDAMKALRIYLRDHRRFRTVGRPGLI